MTAFSEMPIPKHMEFLGGMAKEGKLLWTLPRAWCSCTGTRLGSQDLKCPAHVVVYIAIEGIFTQA